MTPSKTINVYRLALIFCAALAGPAAARGQSFDSSGNGLLHGTYYFREVFYILADDAGDIGRALALYGNLTFDGNGNYSLTNGTVLDSNAGAGQTYSTTGTYTIAASGYGYLSSPIAQGDAVYGLVSNGMFIGSSTETTVGYNDLVIAAPIASPLPTNATFQGSWTVAGFLPAGRPVNTADVFFQMNPDGAGNLGTVTVQGYYGGGGTNVLQQVSPNVKYVFRNGAGVVTFPNSNTAPYYVGDEYLYFSPDGNFFFGGSPNDYDMIVGVRNPAAGAVQNFAGLYYHAGIDEDVSTLSSQGYANLDTFYGAFNATGGVIIAADRLLSQFNANAYGSTYADSYPTPVMPTYKNGNVAQYAFANNGAIRIGAGIWPYLSMSVALQAPAPSGSGVYLYPQGVVNSASQAPFTAGVSGGDLVTLYGSNLAAGTVVASTVPFPTTLGGVQVLVNGAAAPIYYVSSGQISVIIPSGIPSSIAAIQVINNNVQSNVVTEFINKTTPGIFTQTATGIGYAAVVHNDTGALVTPSNPARPGEYIQIFTTGLGAVFPQVADGSPGPVNPLSNTTNTINVYIGGATATVVFAGLAPTLAGLYQVNVQIPAGLTAGDNTLDISGPDSYSAQVSIPVGGGSAAAASSSATPQAITGRRRLPQRRAPVGQHLTVPETKLLPGRDRRGAGF